MQADRTKQEPGAGGEASRVVVITGASSGIARAAALLFAQEGCALVLAARDATALDHVAEDCRGRGARALAVPTDMSDEAAVKALASAAVEAFGRIDVWVNCAAVLMYGRAATQPMAEFRQVIDTNLFGYVHGTQAALRAFKAQGGWGCLINVASMLSLFGDPYLSAYVTSKFAVRGYTQCVRQEMRAYRGIHVCTILPTAIDTPIYQKGANRMGRQIRSIAPLYAVERAARAITTAARRPRAEIIVGTYGYLIALGLRISPRLVEWMVALLAPKIQFSRRRQAASRGNLFESTGPNQVNGGWRAFWLRRLWRR
ncbi:SDR family oxidoreductase [Rhizobium sp. YIM 134829]|uniref:SDR family oxidoreductase n=1 Tax=Rhizobium sp. YIM 134829 TaxID=3390453 RepID=UPI00397B14EA